MNKKIYAGSQVKAVGDRAFRFILSSDAVDRDNDVINQRGWQLDRYQQNPIVLWSHDYAQPPIAKCVAISAANGRLEGTAQFPPMGLHPFADTIHDLIKAGYLSATSVGFRPITYTYNGDRGGHDIEEQELLEWSVVSVGANQDALIQQRRVNAAVSKSALGAWLKGRAPLSDDRILVVDLESVGQTINQVVTDRIREIVGQEVTAAVNAARGRID